MSPPHWKQGDFNVRHYTVEGGEGSELAKARHIEAQVLIDGQPYIRIQLREPGMLTIVSRPADDHLDVFITQPRAKTDYGDTLRPDGTIEACEPWMASALGLNR